MSGEGSKVLVRAVTKRDGNHKRALGSAKRAHSMLCREVSGSSATNGSSKNCQAGWRRARTREYPAPIALRQPLLANLGVIMPRGGRLYQPPARRWKLTPGL